MVWAGRLQSIIAWFKECEPRGLEKTRWARSCKDYTRYRQTGQAYGKIIDMSANYAAELHTKGYDGTILKEIGISELLHLLSLIKTLVDKYASVERQAA